MDNNTEIPMRLDHRIRSRSLFSQRCWADWRKGSCSSNFMNERPSSIPVFYTQRADKSRSVQTQICVGLRTHDCNRNSGPRRDRYSPHGHISLDSRWWSVDENWSQLPMGWALRFGLFIHHLPTTIDQFVFGVHQKIFVDRSIVSTSLSSYRYFSFHPSM